METIPQELLAESYQPDAAAGNLGIGNPAVREPPWRLPIRKTLKMLPVVGQARVEQYVMVGVVSGA
jgi:hypothetical protein